MHSNREFTPWIHKVPNLWCTKRKGRTYYLGKTESEAKERYYQYQTLIERGLPIPPLGVERDHTPSTPTIKTLCLVFLEAQERRVNSGDLSQRSLNDYAKTCKDFCAFVGENVWVSELGPEHFEKYREDVAQRRNPVQVGNEVTRVKTIFKTLYEDRHIDQLPRFGKAFKRPKKATVRAHKHAQGRKTLERHEVLWLMNELGVHERSMVLLGINGGFGNSDVSTLPIADVDLEAGLIRTLRWSYPLKRCHEK